MSKEIKVARLISGETVVFEAVDSESEITVLKNPHCVVGTPQGPGLAPMMPWAAKGVDYNITLRSTDVMFYFPEEHCEPIVQSYTAATSRLDLSGLAGVSRLPR